MNYKWCVMIRVFFVLPLCFWAGFAAGCADAEGASQQRQQGMTSCPESSSKWSVLGECPDAAAATGDGGGLAITSAHTVSFAFGSFVGNNLFGYVGGAGNVQWTGTNAVFASVPIEAGHTLTDARVFVRDNGTGPTTLIASLRYLSGSGVSATIASSSPSSGVGTVQTLTIGPFGAATLPDTAYFIQVGNASGTAPVGVYMASVDYN